MDITGSGISSPLRVEIDTDFQPRYVRALKWARCSSGKWVAADRTSSADMYQCEVTVNGYEPEINTLLSTIYDNRTASSGTPNQLTLSNFADTEKIFGEDVDHGSIDATVIDVGIRQQRSFNSFAVRIKFQAISPSFLGSATGAITLDNWDYQYAAYSQRTIDKHDTYSGDFYYADQRADRGVFEGVAYISNANMQIFLRTLASQRAAAITTTISGVGSPFGPNRSTGSWPRNLKYLDVQDLGYWGLHYHQVRIKAVEDL